MYIISACLLGKDCRYNGGNNYSEKANEFLRGKSYIAVCPEVAGGFPVPRPPVELREGGAYRPDGEDVTAGFIAGAEAVLAEALAEAKRTGQEIELAILKANSPSCGAGRVYDGTFSGRKTAGDGMLTRLLKQNGIKVITEEDIK